MTETQNNPNPDHQRPHAAEEHHHHHHDHEHHHHEHEHVHHHHHHHREEYQAYLEHRKKKRRRIIRAKILKVAAILFVIISFFVIGMALFAPGLLQSLTSKETDLGNGVFGAQSTNKHIRLDYNGIDVSHHQGLIDWDRVALDTCVQFVYIKATEGSDLVDEYYTQNVAGVRKAKIPFGSYHYLTSKSSVQDQFRNFYGIVDRRIQVLAPVIDIEQEGVAGWTREEIQTNLALMIKLIEEHYHCSPIIYSYARFYNEMLAPRFNSYRLFLAHYNMRQPVVAGAGTHNIWQHSDQGVVDGIETPVDLDVYAEGTSLKDLLISSKY